MTERSPFKTKQIARVMSQLRLMKTLVLCSSVVFSGILPGPVASAFQLEIQDDANVRGFEGDSYEAVGRLNAGSVIDVPDRYKVVRNGRIDVKRSLNRWLLAFGNEHLKNPNLGRSGDKKDFFFPVHIVRGSEGSKVRGLKTNREYYMSLRYLAQRGALLETNEDANVYNWKHVEPLVYRSARRAMYAADGATYCAECENESRERSLSESGRSNLRDVGRALRRSRRDVPTYWDNSDRDSSGYTEIDGNLSRKINTTIRYAMAHADQGPHGTACWHYVKQALYASGLVKRGSLATGYAHQAVADLQRQGWTNLITHGHSDLLRHKDRAPVGSVIVENNSEDSHGGHTLIRTRSGYVSDFYTTRSSTYSNFHVIGVMVPPGYQDL